MTSSIPGTGGQIREKPGNFVVEEIPLYEPSGTGGHLYANITKEMLTTQEVARMMAEAIGVNESEIGFAGMKDKNAIATQTFSIPSKDSEIMIEKIKSLPIKLNWAKFHGNKLRRGHLLGNRFRILITGINDIESAYEKAGRTCYEIKRNGIPNYFGSQRFGIVGDNHEKGKKIILGKMRMKNPWLRRFLISSFQSDLCNQYLAMRVEKNLFAKILPGDIAKKYETGGLFEVEDVDIDQKRYENHEISFTAPIYGCKMRNAVGKAGELEKEILEQSGITMSDLGRAKIIGTRRLGRLLVPDLVLSKTGSDILLDFFLPKGAFATTVLREIMKNPEEIIETEDTDSE